jgi:hypothetical protein
MTSGMTLKDLKLYFEAKVDPEFYFFNPMHGWTIEDYDAEFEPRTFTLYQCINSVWHYIHPDNVTEIFEVCVTSGTSSFDINHRLFRFSYVGSLGPHSKYTLSIESLKLECIYFINELAKLEMQDPLERAKESLIMLHDIWQEK